MIEGVMLTWFVLTALSLIFIIIDIRNTPEAGILKTAFIILVVFTGPLGAFFYVLGCREPLAGTHEQYVSATWRQVLGSTMHCAAGDGVGIIAGAIIGALLHLSPWGDFTLEYFLGFGFGWAYFQAFAMRDMVDGSYLLSLKETFIPELVSMNLLMTGMVPTMKYMMPRIDGANDPTQPAFWFTVSMALIVGFILAYPVNWWLVVNNMKHGMLTVRPGAADSAGHGAHQASTGHNGGDDMAGMADMGGHGGSSGSEGHDDHGGGEKPGSGTIMIATAITFAFLAAGLWVAGGFFV